MTGRPRVTGSKDVFVAWTHAVYSRNAVGIRTAFTNC